MRMQLWWLSDKLNKSFSLCEYCLWCQCDQPRLGYQIMGKHPGLSHGTKRRIRRREEVALEFKLIRAKYWACIIQKVTAEKRNIKVLYPFSDRNDFFLLLTLIGDWCRTAPDLAYTALLSQHPLLITPVPGLLLQWDQAPDALVVLCQPVAGHSAQAVCAETEPVSHRNNKYISVNKRVKL